MHRKNKSGYFRDMNQISIYTISVLMTCSPGYFIDGTTGKYRQCADGSYQPHPSQVNILSYKDGLQTILLIYTKITKISSGIIFLESMDIDL